MPVARGVGGRCRRLAPRVRLLEPPPRGLRFSVRGFGRLGFSLRGGGSPFRARLAVKLKQRKAQCAGSALRLVYGLLTLSASKETS